MNNKITFPRLATMLADESGRSKRFSEDFLREFFAIISEELENGGSVKIKGFGTFRLSRVEPRKSVDVTTGQPMEISGHSKVVFLPAKELAEAVNAPFESFTTVEIGDDVDITSLETIENAPVPENVVEPQSVSEEVIIESEPVLEIANEVTPKEAEAEPETESAEPDMIETEAETLESEIEMPVEEPEAETAEEEIEMPVEEPEEAETELEEFETESAEVETKEEEPESTEEEVKESKSQPDAIDAESEGAESDSEEEEKYAACSIGSPVRYFEENKPDYRRNWNRGFLMGMLASLLIILVAAGVAAFLIWPEQIKQAFGNIVASNNEVTAEEIAIPDSSQKATLAQSTVAEAYTVQSTAETASSAETQEADSQKAAPAKEDVPTAPSDAIVLDTISTTRYLTTMAKRHYGNFHLWPIIYEENKAKIGHPDRIRPGTPVVIPPLKKYGIDPKNKEDVERMKRKGIEIYARYNKK